ncbi:MAG: ATP synthase F1 subunit delta [Oscillospiraceae bacterium]|nr:ATP synthase F1 subunit delta [Oscillospiraceae bacterium]MBQ7130723.1 ATP synthase F1 subunit delta [Oscillospiraceae bacterium]
MTQIGNVYGESLYELAKEENLTAGIIQQLKVLKDSFRQEPDFVKLLSTPSLTKAERCKILDDSFRGTVHPYVLNFLKILTEKGYMRYFSDCCDAFAALYNQDNGILPVTAVTAVALSEAQAEKLTGKLAQLTGKHIELMNRIDPSCLGGVRLDYDGQRLDDTVSHRMDTIRDLLKNTVL